MSLQLFVPRKDSNTVLLPKFWVLDYLGAVSPIVAYLQLLQWFDAPAFSLLEPHNASGPVSNLKTCVMNFGKSSAALLVPYSPPSPDPVPPLPRGINTIRGRKCGNPQQRAPSLNTNNQRPPNNTKSALLSCLLFYVWASENLLLSSQYYHSAFSCPLLKKIIWRALIGLRSNGEQIEWRFWRRNVSFCRLQIKYYFCSISQMEIFINISVCLRKTKVWV